jgi:spore germination protein GerM
MVSGRLAASATVLALVVAACSGGGGGDPVVVPHRDVPFGLIDPPRPALDDGDATFSVLLYYLEAGNLIEIARPTFSEPTARRALRGLLAGPSVSEQAFGATSALPSSASARLVHVSEQTARVELAHGFRDGTVANQPAALAQIVFTLTAIPGIDAVTFSIDGSDVAVPTAAGNLVEGPVTREQYAELLGDTGSRTTH